MGPALSALLIIHSTIFTWPDLVVVYCLVDEHTGAGVGHVDVWRRSPARRGSMHGIRTYF